MSRLVLSKKYFLLALVGLIFALLFYRAYQNFHTFAQWNAFISQEQKTILVELKQRQGPQALPRHAQAKLQVRVWMQEDLPFVDPALKLAYLEALLFFYETYEQGETQALFEAYNNSVRLFNPFSS